MEISMQFTLAIDKMNQRIAELNIILSKDPNNEAAKNKLQILLNDKNLIYKGTPEEFEKLIKKYGSNK